VNPEAILITQPSVDFRTFIGLVRQVTGRNPAEAADASRRELSDAERFLSCLASLRNAKVGVGLSTYLLPHASFSAFIGADDRDLLDILQHCAGMPFVTAETNVRGVQIAVVTGTLAQWRDAVVSGCHKDVEPPVRHCFNKLHGWFMAAGLNVWGDFQVRQAGDYTFVLENKRG